MVVVFTLRIISDSSQKNDFFYQQHPVKQIEKRLIQGLETFCGLLYVFLDVTSWRISDWMAKYLERQMYKVGVRENTYFRTPMEDVMLSVI